MGNNQFHHWADEYAQKILEIIPASNSHPIVLNCILNDHMDPVIIRNILTGDFIYRALKKSIAELTIRFTTQNNFEIISNIIEKLQLPCSTVSSVHEGFSNEFFVINLFFGDMKNPPDFKNCLCMNTSDLAIEETKNTDFMEQFHKIVNIYEPKIVRWFVARKKIDDVIYIKFDANVIKNYERFDHDESVAYGSGKMENDERKKIQRIYELSQNRSEPPALIPFRPPFQKLCNILQMYDLDISKAYAYFMHEIKNDVDKSKFTQRAERALFWVEHHAPKEFNFKINKTPLKPELTKTQAAFVTRVFNFFKSDSDEIETNEEIYDKILYFSKEQNLAPDEANRILYLLILGQNNGPHLGELFRTLDRNRILQLLNL